MGCYNRVNGKWAREKSETMRKLRKEFGYRGLVMPGVFAVHCQRDEINGHDISGETVYLLRKEGKNGRKNESMRTDWKTET